MNGFIRIISGKYKGKKLPVLDFDDLRPTTDRTKETLFNWLMPIIKEAKCLDCFAGSGSLGFEALSRGASFVTMIEHNPAVVKQLKSNLNTLECHNNLIIEANTINWLSKKSETEFNLIFLDPPFKSDYLIKVINLLEENNWLSDDAYIYIETKSIDLETQIFFTNWNLHRKKKFGQAHTYLFIRTK